MEKEFEIIPISNGYLVVEETVSGESFFESLPRAIFAEDYEALGRLLFDHTLLEALLERDKPFRITISMPALNETSIVEDREAETSSTTTAAEAYYERLASEENNRLTDTYPASQEEAEMESGL